MKPSTLNFTSVLFLLAIIVSSCENGDIKDSGVELPYEEYSLAGTSSYWTNLKGDKRPLLVNSYEELKNYIVGTDYPAIDFSRKTLLLVGGPTDYGVHQREVCSFQELTAGNYKLNVKVTLNYATVAEGWSVSLLIDKLDDESKVELNLTIQH